MSQQKTFDIGLVMAGAISAGAYTAGVVDFLLLALEEWEQAKARNLANPNFPHHGVRLRVMAGSSAGGMTAALTAARIARSGARPDPLLHDAWVNEIDFAELLKDDDLQGGRGVRSILNGNAIDRIARLATDDSLRDPSLPPDIFDRSYLPDPLHVLLTVSNLRGVPYGARYAGGTVSHYEMLTHGDWYHFALSRQNPPPMLTAMTPGVAPHEWLPADLFAGSSWDLLRSVAAATGAFPAALPSRHLARTNTKCYDALVRRIGVHPATTQLGHFPIPPRFPPTQADYAFHSVDGGMLNNEPVDLARRVLGLNPFDTSHRSGEAALLLVDPFPNEGAYAQDEPGEVLGLFSTIGSVLKALKNQARFQPEELAQALDPDNETQYMITPRRSGWNQPLPLRSDGQPVQWLNIACGSLGGFGGFLHRMFREHDYQLGRRNCQRFLSERFTLSGKNRTKPDGKPAKKAELFGVWEPAPDDPVWADTHDEFNTIIESRVSLPVIPLFGEAAKEQVMSQPWPVGAFSASKADELHTQIRWRMEELLNGYGIPKLLAKTAARPLTSWAAGRAVQTIKTQLFEAGLD